MNYSRIENKYSDLLYFINNIIAGKIADTDSNIRHKVSAVFDIRVNDAKTELLYIAQNNKQFSSFAALDFRKPEAFDIVERETTEYFNHTYLPRIVDLIKQLKTAPTKDPIVAEIIDIFEKKTPVVCLKELIATEAPSEEDPEDPAEEPTEEKKKFKRPTFDQMSSVAKGVTGTAILAGSRKSLLGGAAVVGGAAAGAMFGKTGRGLMKSAGAKVLTSTKSMLNKIAPKLADKIPTISTDSDSSTTTSRSFSRDNTPKEEALEAGRTQGKMLSLLEQIEKNTRGGTGSAAEKKSGGWMSALGSILGSWFGKLISIGSKILGFLAPVGEVLAAIASALGLKKLAKALTPTPNVMRPNPARGGTSPGGVAPKGGTIAKAAKFAKGATIAGAAGLAADFAVNKAVEKNVISEETGEVAGGAIEGAAYGAMIGSFIPAVGTAVGGVIGGALGAAKGVYNNYQKTKESKGTGAASKSSTGGSFSVSGTGAGSLTRQLESNGDYGAVNANDNGKPSYGAYQFREGSGLTSVFKVIRSDKRFEPIRQALAKNKIGSKEFNATWKELAKGPNAKLFAEAQDLAWKKDYYDPATKTASALGFKVNDKFAEVIASAWTVSPTAAQKALKAVAQQHGKNLTKMTTAQQGEAIVKYLENNSPIDKGRLKKTAAYISAGAATTGGSVAPSTGGSTSTAPAGTVSGMDSLTPAGKAMSKPGDDGTDAVMKWGEAEDKKRREHNAKNPPVALKPSEVMSDHDQHEWVKQFRMKQIRESRAKEASVTPSTPSKQSIAPSTTPAAQPQAAGNTIVAPTNNTNINQTVNREIPNPRNRMNTFQEFQVSRFAAP